MLRHAILPTVAATIILPPGNSDARQASTAPVVGQDRSGALNGVPGGREQANQWIPMEMLEATTVEKRRDLMLDRIREELAARKSTIDTGEVERILAAMRTLDRESFVPPAQRRAAYLPFSLDIGEGQTLSDAYLVTVLLAGAAIAPKDRVLDIGTGSGFQAALLRRMGARVTTIEILPNLAKRAATLLRKLGFDDIVSVTGDGARGWPSAAPFDAIVVAAGATAFPPALVQQLAPGGRLVMPIGPTQLEEQLLILTKDNGGRTSVCSLGLAAAVPLTGQQAEQPRVTDPGATRLCYGRPVT